MRAVIQRVNKASVTINEKIKTSIGKGLLVLVSIEINDTGEDIDWLCKKIAQLRIFNDKNGIMNIPITEAGGEILAISQFTLHAKTKKGNRPSYIHSAKPDVAIPLYEKFVQQLEQLLGKEVQTGEFGTYMKVELVNDGPVTIFIDTKRKE